jgi:hypothetical protein
MSSATSALKASKSIVDSYVSTTEKSNLTTTFTESMLSDNNSNTMSKKNILGTILNIVKHPKFKWIVIAILLCICVFIYFKSQNKEVKIDENKEQIEDTRIEIMQDKEGRPILVDKKEQNYIDKITNLELKEKQLLDKINKLNADNILRNKHNFVQQHQQPQKQVFQSMPNNVPQYMPHHVSHHVSQPVHHVPQPIPQPVHHVPQPVPQPVHQPIPQPVQPVQHVAHIDESESSEEVFIEHENVMNHNLTIDEMNAIDKQLEDANFNNMEYESD